MYLQSKTGRFRRIFMEGNRQGDSRAMPGHLPGHLINK